MATPPPHFDCERSPLDSNYRYGTPNGTSITTWAPTRMPFLPTSLMTTDPPVSVVSVIVETCSWREARPAKGLGWRQQPVGDL
jgi:hypothetical protein